MILLEIRRQKWIVLVWSLLLFLLVVSSITKYDMVVSDPATNQMIAKLPRVVLIMFGMTPGLDLSVFVNYMAVTLTYTVIMASFFGVVTGHLLTSRDQEDGILEYVYTRPLTRKQILLKKYVAGICIQLFFISCFVLSLILSYVMAKQPLDSMIIPIILGHLLIQLLFYHLAFVVMSIYHKNLVYFVLIFFFVLAKITDLLNLSVFLTPFKWFDPMILLTQNWPIVPTVIVIVVMIAAIGFGYFQCQSKEVLS